MKRIKKILVAYDGSEHATEAVTYAADLACRYQASLLILFVDQPVVVELPAGEALANSERIAQIRASIERDLAAAQSTARAAGVTQVDSLVQRGNPVTEIVNRATQGGFDLIAMGTHGRRGLSRVLLGSVAENVLRRAPCPVLMVHSQATEQR